MKKFINTSNGGQSKRNGNLIVTKKCNVWVWTKFTSFLFAVRTSTIVTEFKKWSFLLNDDNSKLWAGGKVLHFLLFRTKNSTTISSELAFFLHFLAPEKPRHVTLILHTLRWRLSWLRSIAGAGNDLGKRAKLNFPYTFGGFLKSVLVVSFTLENGVFDKFSMTSFQKPQLHWSALIFNNVLLRSTKENAYYSSLVPAGFTMSRGYCSGWHTISRFGRHLGLTGWLPYL